MGLVAAGLGLLLYVNTLGHQYCLDDFSVIGENWITKGGLKNIGLIFSSEYRAGYWAFPGSLYRPLSMLVFAIQWQLSPDNPFLGHFTNLILYALTGWLLWITWRRILYKYSPLLPALGLLFFIAHPVHTEAVANIKSLDEILAFLFGIWSLYMLWQYLERKDKKWLFGSLGVYALALFSKESAITYLAVYPAVLYFFGDKSLKESLRMAAWYLIPAALFLLIRQVALGGQAYAETISPIDNFIVMADGPGQRLASACMMAFRYMQTLVVPFPLSSDLGYAQYKVVTFSDWRAIAGILMLLGMAAGIGMQWSRKSAGVFFALCFLVYFSISSNLFLLIGTSYAERTLYAPAFGFCFFLAWFLLKLAKISVDPNESLSTHIRNPNRKGKLVWGIGGSIIIIYSLLTLMRNPAWQDSYTLYKTDLATAPNSARLNYLLGLEVMKKGRNLETGEVTDFPKVKEAIQYYTQSITLFPENADALSSRGQAYSAIKQYNLSYVDYRAALAYRPNDDRVLSNLGFIYFNRNQLDSAEYVFRKAIEYNPRFIDARRNLGAVLATNKNFAGAIEIWKAGLQYDPGNATLIQYIRDAYRELGDLSAVKVWDEKLKSISK